MPIEVIIMLLLTALYFIFMFFFGYKDAKNNNNVFGKIAAMTPIEKRMYYALKKAGYDPIPQYPIRGYRLDFAIFKNGIKLDVECDGKDFHSSPAQKKHDRKRTQVLNRAGWNVIRFSGSQIYRNVHKCVESINKKFGIQ
ncbi:MAG: DUF559 domain-containing protein [Bacillota bacterium]|nr:DUF559 domain-containing protein [Bacillota bacterium]